METTALKPLYKVELVTEKRKRYYQATALDGSWQYRFQGTTGISGMLDDGKSHGFASSAAKITRAKAMENLLSIGADPVILEPDFVNNVLNGCEKHYLKEWGFKRDRGSMYHEMLEKKINGEAFESTPEFDYIWASLQDKLMEHSVDILSAEVPCASIIHKFGTKIDGVGRSMGDYGVLDWKFARFISSEHYFQVGGGSAQAFTETYGVPAKWAKVFRWDFDSKFWEVATVKDTSKALRGLLGLLDVKTQIEEGLYV
jgi:hypothetical protein